MRRGAAWAYDASNMLRMAHGGAGNNWAMGYKQYGRRCGKRVLDSVRREAERADALGALVVAQSVAGGTGSGLGTAITELLQDE